MKVTAIKPPGPPAGCLPWETGEPPLLKRRGISGKSYMDFQIFPPPGRKKAAGKACALSGGLNMEKWMGRIYVAWPATRRVISVSCSHLASMSATSLNWVRARSRLWPSRWILK